MHATVSSAAGCACTFLQQTLLCVRFKKKNFCVFASKKNFCVFMSNHTNSEVDYNGGLLALPH